MKEFNILLIVLIILFIFTNKIRKNIHLELVQSKVNNVKYYVRKLPDKQKAADKLGELSLQLVQLIESLKNKNKKGISRLVHKFNPDIITENIPGSSHVAYSVNKGEELSICIRKINTNEFIDNNTILFVAIHELAHIMSESTGHTPEFWDNMKYLLEQASEINIYQPIDYSKTPVIYCGQEINSTPMNL